MAKIDQISEFLQHNSSFTTRDFIEMMGNTRPGYSERKAYYDLKKLQDDGKIMKTSRGHYTGTSVKKPYHYEMSDRMNEIVELIRDRYPMVAFQTWELYQWNEFVNHQFAHNAFFVEVEGGLETAVFESLLEQYPRVLFKPDTENYYRYRSDDMIIIQKLLSGSPAPIAGTSQASLEKLLVDIFSRELTGQLIERAEYREIYQDAFEKYVINESMLFRYAGRRHLEQDIRRFIATETTIELRPEKMS